LTISEARAGRTARNHLTAGGRETEPGGSALDSGQRKAAPVTEFDRIFTPTTGFVNLDRLLGQHRSDDLRVDLREYLRVDYDLRVVLREDLWMDLRQDLGVNLREHLVVELREDLGMNLGEDLRVDLWRDLRVDLREDLRMRL
jgi:hypothetical protein